QGRAREQFQIAALVAALARLGERVLQRGPGRTRRARGRRAALRLGDGQRDPQARQRERAALAAGPARLVDELERRLDAVHVAERADHQPGDERAGLQVLRRDPAAALAERELVPPVLALLVVRRLPPEGPQPPLLAGGQRAGQERAA